METKTTKKFDMNFIRYINLFGRITRVDARHCFIYNNTLVFVVPAHSVQMAIGRENSNLKKLSNILGKRIRVVEEPFEKKGKDIEKFVSVIVSPIKFNSIEIIDSEDKSGKIAVITTPGRESRAMLIGRDRARESELKEILSQYFGVKGLKIA